MPDPLYKTEGQIAALVGVSTDDWKAIAVVWEKDGFPVADPQTGKRYWPAVKAWLDRRHGVGHSEPTLVPDGVEDHDYARSRGTRARA